MLTPLEATRKAQQEAAANPHQAVLLYVAAYLGAQREWSGADMLEGISIMIDRARDELGWPQTGGDGDDKLAWWRLVAEDLGLDHDGEDEDLPDDDREWTDDDGTHYLVKLSTVDEDDAMWSEDDSRLVVSLTVTSPRQWRTTHERFFGSPTAAVYAFHHPVEVLT
jgi:hypothetical protein